MACAGTIQTRTLAPRARTLFARLEMFNDTERSGRNRRAISGQRAPDRNPVRAPDGRLVVNGEVCGEMRAEITLYKSAGRGLAYSRLIHLRPLCRIEPGH